MKALKFRKAGGMLLTLVFLALFLSVPAAAARPPIDGSKVGSISIDLSGSGGTGSFAAGIRFTAYRVAELSLPSEDYSLTGEFSASGLDLKELATAPASTLLAAAKNLAGYISAHGIAGISPVADPSGLVKFSGLALGYYLMVPSDNTAGQTGRIACDPFFVPVPMKSGSAESWVWVYDIVAKPKTEAMSGAVILKKMNPSDSPLSGAIFRLDKKVYYNSPATPPSGAQTGTDGNGTYYWSTAVSELTTNRYGQIAVKGMEFAPYRFVELRAPSGYRLDSTPHEFTVSSVGSVTVDAQYQYVGSGGAQTITVRNSSRPPHDNSSNPSSTPSTPSTPSSSSTPSEVSEPSVPYAPPSSGVENVSEDQVPGAGFNLPKTGGSIAYAVCTFGGVFLMLCGAVVFVLSRKKHG